MLATLGGGRRGGGGGCSTSGETGLVLFLLRIGLLRWTPHHWCQQDLSIFEVSRFRFDEFIKLDELGSSNFTGGIYCKLLVIKNYQW